MSKLLMTKAKTKGFCNYRKYNTIFLEALLMFISKSSWGHFIGWEISCNMKKSKIVIKVVMVSIITLWGSTLHYGSSMNVFLISINNWPLVSYSLEKLRWCDKQTPTATETLHMNKLLKTLMAQNEGPEEPFLPWLKKKKKVCHFHL